MLSCTIYFVRFFLLYSEKIFRKIIQPGTSYCAINENNSCKSWIFWFILSALWVLQYEWMFLNPTGFQIRGKNQHQIEIQVWNKNAKLLLEVNFLLLFCDERKHRFLHILFWFCEIMIWSEVFLVWFCLLTNSSYKCRHRNICFWSLTIRTTKIFLVQRAVSMHPPDCRSILF